MKEIKQPVPRTVYSIKLNQELWEIPHKRQLKMGKHELSKARCHQITNKWFMATHVWKRPYSEVVGYFSAGEVTQFKPG